MDANAAGLRRFSQLAIRAGLPNVLFVRAAIERLPPELNGVADRVTVVLPWGSLLSAVALPSPETLRCIRELCAPKARLVVVLGTDARRDQAEMQRLGLPAAGPHERADAMAAGYAAAGFAVKEIRALSARNLARWPSTWARRLGHGGDRTFWEVEASAERRAGERD